MTKTAAVYTRDTDSIGAGRELGEHIRNAMEGKPPDAA
jgi:hypothetical protein